MRIFVTIAFGACAALAACSPASEPSSEVSEIADDGAQMASREGEGHEGHNMMKMEVSEREARDKEEAAALLVERFDAQSCVRADMLGTVRKSEPDGAQTILRAFSAPVACAEEVSAAFEAKRFAQTEPGIHSASSGDTKERVLIDRAEDGSGSIIEWEVDQK